MAVKFDEFMEDIENDIRQEKYMTLWKRYGKVITWVTGISLICLIGYNLKSQYEIRQSSKDSDIFIGAQEYSAQNRQAEAISALKNLIEHAAPPYDTFAKINEAGLLSIGDATQKQQAIELYQEIISSKTINKIWRDLAVYKKIALQSEQAGINIDDLLQELTNIEQEESPFYFLVAELKGIMTLKKGDKIQAGEIFLKLAQNKTAPEGVIIRSQLMTQLISTGSS